MHIFAAKDVETIFFNLNVNSISPSKWLFNTLIVFPRQQLFLWNKEGWEIQVRRHIASKIKFFKSLTYILFCDLLNWVRKHQIYFSNSNPSLKMASWFLMSHKFIIERWFTSKRPKPQSNLASTPGQSGADAKFQNGDRYYCHVLFRKSRQIFTSKSPLKFTPTSREVK